MRSTEAVDPRYADIDTWPTADAVAAMLDGQLSAVKAVQAHVATIANAAETAAARLGDSGRLIYVGAGTSGRVAVQDGVELGPTFGWPAARLAYLLAGGDAALAHSVEGAEDAGDDARAALAALRPTAADVVIGVAASGRTPFTLAAVTAARAAGALTIAIANNADAPLADAADIGIAIDTGSEVIAGSTRMKAGTAQKVVLNLLSTAIMLRLGRVYRGLMVDMVISNAKLRQRALGMVETLAPADPATAAAALEAADDDIKRAVLIAGGLTREAADDVLARSGNVLRRAIEALERGPA